MIRRLLLLAVAVAVLGLAGCGERDDEETATAPTAAAEETATEEATPAGGDLTDTETKPVIPKPSGEPPAELKIEDIVKGKGRAAKAGDSLTVNYAGVAFSTGAEFDASWNSGQPFTFDLGAGNVIPGWDEGLVGMKAGGRRMLTIPPDMAYGEQGSPPAIGPNETLIFVVDLEKIG